MEQQTSENVAPFDGRASGVAGAFVVEEVVG
jgi:hypothetical protein